MRNCESTKLRKFRGWPERQLCVENATQPTEDVGPMLAQVWDCAKQCQRINGTAFGQQFVKPATGRFGLQNTEIEFREWKKNVGSNAVFCEKQWRHRKLFLMTTRWNQCYIRPPPPPILYFISYPGENIGSQGYWVSHNRQKRAICSMA